MPDCEGFDGRGAAVEEEACAVEERLVGSEEMLAVEGGVIAALASRGKDEADHSCQYSIALCVTLWHSDVTRVR